jgi:hypothetical protein
MKTHLKTSLVCATVASLVAASPAPACEKEQGPKAKTTAARPVAGKQAAPKAEKPGVGQAGLVVVRDAATGELRAPEGNELQALEGQMRSMFSDSAEGLKEYPLPGGGFGMNLEGRFQSVAVARVGANGKVEWTCAESARQAAKFMKAPPAAPAAPEEK